MSAVDSIHRKLRSLVAVLQDPAATEHERANAQALKARLEKRLRQAGVPAGDWTDRFYRLGRTARGIEKSTAPPPSISGSAKIGFRLGSALRHGLKKLGPS